MNIYLENLLGELIGLARATDGNEHLITPQSSALLRECLLSRPNESSELQKLLDKVITEKQRMVPDCFYCANPCGRTSAYTLSSLQNEPVPIQIIKKQIIDALLNIDTDTNDVSIYRGLIAIGMNEISTEFLSNILTEIKPEKQ